MSQPAIEIQTLGKEYQLGGAEVAADNFREMLAGALIAPLRKLKRLGGQGNDQERIWALKDVSFTVKRGEVIGIIGRNGAGKSTLLKILSRITEPTEGRAITRGRVASLLEVGTGFHPELTGRENIFLNGAILGMSATEIQSRFEAIVDFAGIERFLDTPVKRYSSGMYVRLAFSIAAHLDPDILIVDEVLAVGDAEFQKKCLGKMKDISSGGRTVLFVSHNLTAVASFCDRCICLKNGRLEKDGTTDAVISHYLSGDNAGSRDLRWSDNSAPGNELVTIHSVSTCRKGDSPEAPIGISDSINVATEYSLLTPGLVTHITYVLSTIHGITCFSTFGEPRKLDSGRYRQEFTIPGDWLNSGVYVLSLYVVRDSAVHIYSHESILEFEVVENMGRKIGWMRKEPGILRPHLEWSFDVVK